MLNLILLLTAALVNITADTADASQRHKCVKFSLPLIQPGCEGEGCGTIEYFKAIKTVKVFKEPSLKSPIIETLKKCEAIQHFKTFMLISYFGQDRKSVV